ncbi:MAG TPA: energy transducer TonB [Methylocella sp.]
MTTAAKSFLLAEEDPELRRWLIAAAFVTTAHGALALWLMNKHDVNLAGAPPAAIMIELAPLEVTPGPQVTQAEPEEAKPPLPMAVPELPPAPKPAVVLMTPPKPKPKPKKIVKETPKPLVKRTRTPPAMQTSAPPRAAAASTAASSRVANAAEAAAWRSAWSAAMSWPKHYPEAARARGEQGTVRLGLTIGRNGQVISARLIGSSGSSILDQAALEMARNARGRPLPPEMGSSVYLTVPVRYSIR